MKEKIIPFKQVYIWIKRRWLLKLYYSPKRLAPKEIVKLQSDLRKINQAQNRLAHLRSIVEHLLLKA